MLFHVNSLILLLLLVQILQEDALCSKITPFCAYSLWQNSVLELQALSDGKGSRCRAHLGKTLHTELTCKQNDHQYSLSVSATRHFRCRKVPKHSLDVNYLSLTVVLGVQEGIELKLPLTMESRGGRREGKKRGGSSSDHSCALSHTLSSFQLCLFACHNSQREML